MAIFAVHFIYRYGAVKKEFYKTYLKGGRFLILLAFPIIYGLWWGSLAAFLMTPNSIMTEYIRPNLLLQYDLNIENVVYVGTYLHPNSGNGTIIDPVGLFCVLNMYFMIGTSSFCVFYFGIKCYLIIMSALTVTTTASRFAKNLQKQLFYALVVQTMIPVILMYLPASVVITFPLFDYNIGFATRYICVTVAVYPGIDPLPTMFIIKSYRKALKRWLTKILSALSILKNVSKETSTDIEMTKY